MTKVLLRLLTVVVFTVSSGSVLFAQDGGVEAAAADVSTLDGIMLAIYDVISGPVGEERDWDRMRSLFIPEARLIPLAAHPERGNAPVLLSVEDYIERSGSMLEEVGFTEQEISRRVDRFGDIAQVFSTYEGKMTRNGQEQTIRGINSFHLYKDNNRWWIVNIFWQQAGPNAEIPASYLPANEQ